MLKKLFFAATILLLALSAAYVRADFDYTNYSDALKRYVRTGVRTDGATPATAVDYGALVRDNTDISMPFPKLLAQLIEFDPGSLKDSGERAAFWINAYNIAALKLVSDNYPIGSINSEKVSLVRSPLKMKVLYIGGRYYSMAEIEKKIHGEDFPLARFALSCAALGCPDLRPEPYRADGLDEALAQAAVQFINSPKAVQIDHVRGRVYLSKIFSWYRHDFDRIGGKFAVLERYAEKPEDQKALEDAERGALKVRWMKFDWRLNDACFSCR